MDGIRAGKDGKHALLAVPGPEAGRPRSPGVQRAPGPHHDDQPGKAPGLCIPRQGSKEFP